MGESLLDPMFGNDAPVDLFDLFVEKGGCTLTEMPPFPEDQAMMCDPPPAIPPIFAALMVNSETYVKHIFGRMKATGVEDLNPSAELGEEGRQTLLEFATTMVREYLPRTARKSRGTGRGTAAAAAWIVSGQVERLPRGYSKSSRPLRAPSTTFPGRASRGGRQRRLVRESIATRSGGGGEPRG